jgi:hypothetical protein
MANTLDPKETVAIAGIAMSNLLRYGDGDHA